MTMTETDPLAAGRDAFPPDPTGDDASAALAERTDLDEFGSDPDVRFPGTSEDPTMSTADATANAIHPDEDAGQ
jgi:hypothetical protein